ncbi:MAG: VWA domain-containing protein [Acidobacteria bacterium]|jgi:Ca-activated chloride channel homolog|nr:MAG: VWA domain-containing protein [Acidobacteriota bacterium]
MLALRTTLKFLLVLSFVSFGVCGFSQTSLDDVHVASREVAPSLKGIVSADPQGSGIHVIHTDSRLVLVPVSVTDPMQRFVTGLNRDNFEVFEGAKPQTIQHFSSEDVPVSVGIILDISGSMSDKLDRVHDAVNQLCEVSNPQDEYFMITFADEPRLAVDFTTNPDDLRKELVFAQPKGRTSLLDAIHQGLRKMKNAKYGKRALLIISDGGDNHSRYGEREIKGLAKESDVMIYSIGIFDRYVPTPEELRGPSLLGDISDPTGGRAFTVDNPNIMPAIARHIGMELRTQYVLAYRPQETPHNGKWRKIRVRLRLPRKLAFLQAHAKTGYYASADPEPRTSLQAEHNTTR